MGNNLKRAMAKDDDRIRIRTRLTKDRVNRDWQHIGLAQRTWMENYTLPERYELVISDLLNKLDEGSIDELEGLED